MNATRTVRLGALLLAVSAGRAPVDAQSIPSNGYTGTTFVHGFADDGGRFLVSRQSAPGLPLSSIWTKYDAIIDVKQPWFPTLPMAGSAFDQAPYLNTFRQSNGPQVLVAHSFGGVVSRRAHQSNAAGIAGIITIGTPHGGTYVATNRAKYQAYLNTTIQRAREAGFPAAASAGAVGGPIGVVAASAAWYYFGDNVNQSIARLRDSVNKAFNNLPAAPLADAQPGSTALTALQSYAGDATLPRAQVTGTVAVKNYPIHLLASLTGQDANSLIQLRNVATTVLKGCRTVLYATIIFYGGGRKCSRARNMLRNMDSKFFAWSTGQMWGSAQPRLFDGLIEETRAQYPGLSDLNRKLVTPNTDHHALLFRQQGVIDITTAMERIGMRRR